MSSCWAEATCSRRFKEVLEMQDRQTHLNVVSASFALRRLHCSVCPRVKKGKNEVLKSRLYWECLCWKLVIATSESLNTFPL